MNEREGGREESQFRRFGSRSNCRPKRAQVLSTHATDEGGVSNSLYCVISLLALAYLRRNKLLLSGFLLLRLSINEERERERERGGGLQVWKKCTDRVRESWSQFCKHLFMLYVSHRIPPTPEGPLPFNGCMTRTWCSRFPEAEHTHILSRTTNRVETWFDKRRWRWKILSFWMTFRFDFLPSPMWTSPNTQRNLCADVYFSFQTAWRKSRGIRHECHPSLA